ncbi:MAG TPA: beta-N-acetylhexosaminidase [Polyangiaceae bacterium]
MNTAELCGQLLVVGFDGPTLPSAIAEQLSRRELGGVILFKRNLPSLTQIHELTSAVVDVSPDDLPPFIGIDQEGGRVARLPEPCLRLPAMRVLGRIADVELVRRAASVLGRELSALGINLDFAPVLDVDSNPDNPIIGDRAFSSDTDTVARLGRAFIEGLQEQGVLACGKHFPGHGDTNKDSHLDLPRVKHDKARLDHVELPPFRTACLREVAALMTAHVVYDELDPETPATLSRRICTTLLRSEIGFRGVLFSDDLEMRALSDRFSIEQTAVGAVRAGCDALLVCSNRELAQRAHTALVDKAETDPAFQKRCEEAVNRGLVARRKSPPRPVPTFAELEQRIATNEARALLAEIESRSTAL